MPLLLVFNKWLGKLNPSYFIKGKILPHGITLTTESTDGNVNNPW